MINKSVMGTFFATCLLALSPQITLSESAENSTSAAALTGDPAAGEKLYRRNCRACHGAKAKGASSFPKLVGHPAEYLVDKVTRYRSGEKIGPNTPLMAQRVKKLSDQDIANVAAFIVSLEDN